MSQSHRILVVDDNRRIHSDFRKLLMAIPKDDLSDLEASLFGIAAEGSASEADSYTVESAFQGEEGCRLVQESLAEGRPFALAFVDVRMPPGWDGVQTIERILALDPEIQVVICTAYSEYSWEDIGRRFPGSDRLLILRKPFDTAEVCQLAAALTVRWRKARHALRVRAQLEATVVAQTEELRRIHQELLVALDRCAETERLLRESEARFALR